MRTGTSISISLSQTNPYKTCRVSSKPSGQVSRRARYFVKVQSCFPVSVIKLTLIQLTFKTFTLFLNTQMLCGINSL